MPWWGVAGALGVVPLLWFGGDLWGSGDLWHGAGVAQVYADDPDRFRDSLERLAQVVAGPTWPAAAVAVALAARVRDRAVLALAGGALAYAAVVVGMATALGYAAVGRFLLPAAALLCVLAGIGVARAWAWAAAGPVVVRWAGAALLVLVVNLGIADRAGSLDREVRRIGDRDRFEEEVERALAAAGGPAAVTACRRVAIDEDSPARTSLAWMLDVPLGETKRDLLDRPGVVFDRRGTPTAVALEASTGPGVVVLARTPDWLVAAVDCPAATG